MNKSIIPIFPLNGVVFFPNTNLQLNIFEERYVDMINFSLSSNRLIGMIQTNSKNKLYSIGCVGKINSFSETYDNKYTINLIGQNYFRLIKNRGEKNKFILADVSILAKESIDKNDIRTFDTNLLLKKYKKYIDKLDIKINFNIIDQITTEELIKFIAMTCNFTIEDKQMLLETYDIKELGNKLIGLFDFYYNNIDEVKSIN